MAYLYSSFFESISEDFHDFVMIFSRSFSSDFVPLLFNIIKDTSLFLFNCKYLYSVNDFSLNASVLTTLSLLVKNN